jgi:hypothetical protein
VVASSLCGLRFVPPDLAPEWASKRRYPLWGMTYPMQPWTVQRGLARPASQGRFQGRGFALSGYAAVGRRRPLAAGRSTSIVLAASLAAVPRPYQVLSAQQPPELPVSSALEGFRTPNLLIRSY